MVRQARPVTYARATKHAQASPELSCAKMSTGRCSVSVHCPSSVGTVKSASAHTGWLVTSSM
jgi:hypothetical protein